MSKVLYRAISELRSVDNADSRTITGYAVVFDTWSRDLGGFYEIIRKSAITEELIKQSDIIMNVNHDDDKMVARWLRGIILLPRPIMLSFDEDTLSLTTSSLYSSMTAQPMLVEPRSKPNTRFIMGQI